MDGQISFKSRIKTVLIQCAAIYNSLFVCRDHLIVSDAFHKRPYYIISAEKDNYLHLTGVHTSLSASVFFDKCLNGTLTESDFDFSFPNHDPKSVKGSVRRKINALPLISNLIGPNSTVQEDFQKNTIFCSFASSDGFCTLGFVSVPQAIPKTLLQGDELDHTKSSPIKIVLSKNRPDPKFSCVIHGTDEEISRYYSDVGHLLDDDLSRRISAILSLS